MKCTAHHVDYCPTCNGEQLPQPFAASFEGYNPDPENLANWPNTVSVEAVEGYDPTFTDQTSDADMKYADYGEVRQLVQIDTNYKDTRESEYPVRLTRADAVRLAAAILQATDDTFDLSRCGQLRAAEATDLLQALEDVDIWLIELRSHALVDLVDEIHGTDKNAEEGGEGEAPESKGPPVPAPPTEEPDQDEPSLTVEQQFADALGEVFPATLHEIAMSDAYGALKHKVISRCQATGETPTQVLGTVSTSDREFVPNANDPAAFLASRIEP